MEENLLKIFKLADMLNEKQSKIYAEIEYTADNKKKLQISIRAKDTYRYIEKCEIQLANNPLLKWNNIIETSVNPNLRKAQLLYKSEDIIQKMLTDLSDKKIDKIVVNSSKLKNELQKIKDENIEYKNIKIELEKKSNILENYDIEKQLEKMQNRKIWLKCGGFITIDTTEALTAIDVNTGKYTGTKNLEQTVYRVNTEATVEIAKQLRLRDIGGIIIIDYIDMKNEENKEKIEKLLKEELKKDRSKTQVEGFTKLDLMELTRKHICSHKN